MGFFTTGVAISGMAGLFTAAWGAYKDAPYEGFKHASFWRSIAFSVGLFALLATPIVDRDQLVARSGFQLFLLVMGLERLAIEIYKPCFRSEDQTKYLIPQNMAFLGLDVVAPAVRRAVGGLLAAGMLGVVSLSVEVRSYTAHLAVAVVVGLFICCGGAAKDAPFEGFQRRKFLRSALVLAATSPLVYRLGPAPLGMLAFANGGLERLIVESYKTYFTDVPPGKFRRDLPRIDHAAVALRPVFRAIALSIVVALAVLYAYAR